MSGPGPGVPHGREGSPWAKPPWTVPTLAWGKNRVGIRPPWARHGHLCPQMDLVTPVNAKGLGKKKPGLLKRRNKPAYFILLRIKTQRYVHTQCRLI